jgi:hypothetical protein
MNKLPYRVKDYTGQKFGKLAIIKFSHFSKHKKAYWKCLCDCGNEKNIAGASLRRGFTKSCGCIPKRLDISGQKFGKLTAVEFSHKNNFGAVYWKCICDCGNKITTRSNALRKGEKKTCGCVNPNYKHGAIRTRTYISWGSMKQRCANEKATGYKNYGGRGITVCERWLGKDGFVNFLEDMGERPEGLSIDRIYNDGNYEPSNCRWATKKEQENNKRRSKKK